jgi:hypothetical protein
MMSFRLNLEAGRLWLATLTAPRAARPQRSLFGRNDSIAGLSASASGIATELRTLRQLLATRGQDADRLG